ncbi:MAG: N-6 DNA methylase [Byssovorax sp.]
MTAPSLDVDADALVPDRQRASPAAREGRSAGAKPVRAQVLAALRELLAGLQDADRSASHQLLRGQEETVYAGLATVLMRLGFILFAEQRGLLPLESDSYATSYSLTRLHAQLQGDAARDGQGPETRYGAWARILTLFRLIHDGAPGTADFTLPPRRGALFDPDAYPFLEGRPPLDRGQLASVANLPRIPDGVVSRVLDLLLVVGGERLFHGDLDVEHLGTGYEGLMGYEVQSARGQSLTLQPDDVVVDLDHLLSLPSGARIEHLASEAGLDLARRRARAVKAATTPGELSSALSARASPRQRELIPRGALFVQPGQERRRFGAHYTSRAITRIMIERVLAPLRLDTLSPDEILAVKVCDPAMGAGALLVEACRQLGDHLVRAWERTDTAPRLLPDEERVLVLHARLLVARRCLYGVDKNPLAVSLARLSLWLVTSAREHPFTFVDHALRHGDSLVGLSVAQIAGRSLDVGSSTVASSTRARADEAVREVRAIGDLLLRAFFGARSPRERARAMAAVAARATPGLDLAAAERDTADLRARYAPFHWELEFPEVFSGSEPGFSVIVGNPPWVSYAGRAAQPLPDELRDFYAATNPAFHGFRNLQGLFVFRFAAMLRPGGRLGLVLPTSTSDLKGYEPTRRAHDALCLCDDELPDFGEKAFDDVFQPSMGLLSTRRAAAVAVPVAGPWPLERTDLDAATRELLEKLSALAPLPPQLFGERGFQSSTDDVRHLRPASAPRSELTVGVRTGSDIAPFLRRPPELHCDPRVFEGRFRPASDWQSIKLLIRQTARYPMVVLSDGVAFRNSILAGFADESWSEHLLLAYLNSNPVRWLHYTRHRDARQGMPQLKIAHLRSIPAPPRSEGSLHALTRMGRQLGERNTGITPTEQDDLDSLVAQLLSLDDAARARISAFRTSMGK